ncbi:Interferon-activable protein [Hirschfeldia incana]|nr:Interferon-activable protein [Hirschfeldia incana]
MEPAQIDWKRIDSRFVEDVFYEHIRAPKWFDFLAPNHLDTVDDDAWFCKPDCNHPKRPEDFFQTPTSSSKTPGSSTEQKQRRRGHEESENQNPNLATPPRSWRAALKSSSAKKMMSKETTPKLKSTQSARNLFSGRDIFGHISEFCYELKRLATRVTEREDTTTTGKTEVNHHQLYSAHELELKKERKPLLEVSKEKKPHESATTGVKGSTFKENRRRKKRVDDDAENIPVCFNVETVVKMKGEECRRIKRVDDDAENILTPLKLGGNVKNKGHERLLQQIRTNPPSPQCFSDNRTASLKALATKPTVEEVVKRKEEEEQSRDNYNNNKEGRGLDVLWFLKPCSMAN